MILSTSPTFIQVTLKLIELALLQTNLQVYDVLSGWGADSRPLARHMMGIFDSISRSNAQRRAHDDFNSSTQKQEEDGGSVHIENCTGDEWVTSGDKRHRYVLKSILYGQRSEQDTVCIICIIRIIRQYTEYTANNPTNPLTPSACVLSLCYEWATQVVHNARYR